MAIIKKYSHDSKVCQVTFTLPKEICDNFDEISVVGDFNGWDHHRQKFSQRNAQGICSVDVILDIGKEYQFRYLCDGEVWLNEPDADRQEMTPYADAKNSVIVL